MSKHKQKPNNFSSNLQKSLAEKNKANAEKPILKSPLDAMVDGREFESLVHFNTFDFNPLMEIRRALKEISDVRKRPAIVYMANVVNQKIKASRSIDYSDDLPFSELINTIPKDIKDIDVILVTPGGSGTQVAKFVDKLRPRFENVTFIIPDIAMSAGTILAMSGDEIIMTNNSYIGPIDPQVQNKDGIFVPAQSILTLVQHIQKKGNIAISKGLTPDWADLQILRQIDHKEMGNALSASKFSAELVENYLFDYKFKTWTHHKDGRIVTPDEKRASAKKIATDLCDHSLWKSHGRGITREVAWNVCKLKIIHSEDIGLNQPLKRFWALFYWLFENLTIYKIFVSEYYSLVRNDNSLIEKNK